ncbi:MAG: hypothetical protein ACKVQA_07035 [Burkholderiales bacterium]
MSLDDLTLLEQAQRHAASQALDAIEKDKLGRVAFEANTDAAVKSLEVSLQGEKGRLSGSVYARAVWGLTKSYVAGVRGVWTLRKP